MFNFFKSKQSDKNKIDYGKINESISIINIILKIVFILVIILILYMGTKVLTDWGFFRFINIMLTILSPLFIGIVIAWLLNPIVTYMQRKKINRVAGTIITYVVFILVLYLVLNSVLPILSDEINEFAKNVPIILDKIQLFVDGIFDKFENPAFDINATKLELYTKVESAVIEYTSKLPEISINVIKGVFSTLWSIVLGFMIGLYLLFDFDNAIKKTISFIPRRICDSLRSVVNKIDIALKNFIQGTLIVSTIIFLVCSVGFWFAGLKAPVFFGLFCAITNIIPYIGPYIGAAPAVIVGYATSPLVGTVVLIICVAIQFIEGNFIQPLVMSKTMKLHPVTIIVGLLIFGYFFGIVGMIISTPLMSIIKIILTFINEKYDIISISND